jgi:hypothetical protein
MVTYYEYDDASGDLESRDCDTEQPEYQMPEEAERGNNDKGRERGPERQPSGCLLIQVFNHTDKKGQYAEWVQHGHEAQENSEIMKKF